MIIEILYFEHNKYVFYLETSNHKKYTLNEKIDKFSLKGENRKIKPPSRPL